MGQSIIEVKNVKKIYRINQRPKGFVNSLLNLFIPKYSEKNAVNDISFSIREGDMVGFVGTNGAGKSTMIKMLSGILYPDEGEITIDGYIPYKQRKDYVKNIGVVFGQKSQLAWDLPIIDSYNLLKNIYRIPSEIYRENLEQYMELLDMESFIEQPVRQLSLGQRMRADIAASLLHSPKIIFFDEPTIGLDVVAKEKIRNFILELNKEKNITMIFTTHDMKDIEETCKKLILIDKGKKIFDGQISELLERYGRERRVIVEFHNEVNFEKMEQIEIKTIDSTKKELIFDGRKVYIQELIRELSEQYDIRNISIIDPDVEHVIRKIYEGSLEM